MDSTAETLEHIRKVSMYLSRFASELLERGIKHDQSKLESPEKEAFDQLGIELKTVEYGSQEYKDSLERLRPALEHHYSVNSHHPQFYPNGVNGMNLVDLVEMFFDWKAAGERNKNGDIMKSIEINEKRFDISPQLSEIFRNTAKYFGK